MARKLNTEEISQNSPGMGTRSGLQGPCPGQRDILETQELEVKKKAKEQMKNKTRRPGKISKEEEGGITRERGKK